MIYADTNNGRFEMTWDEVVYLVRTEYSTNPDDLVIYDEEGTGYSCREIAEIEGFELME